MKRAAFNFLYRIGLDRLLRRKKAGQLTILSLHRISNDRDAFFEPIRPEAFERLLKYVARHYQVVSFAELPQVKPDAAKPPLILSFDDGYYDFYEFALPLLDRYKLPSNHNIVNRCASENYTIWTQRLNHLFNHCRDHSVDLELDYLAGGKRVRDFGNDWFRFYLFAFTSLLREKREVREQFLKEKEELYGVQASYRMMNWAEVAECAKYKVEIGCHTYSHDVMSTITDARLLQHEIGAAKNELEQKIGRPVDIIALPNGQGNELVNGVVRDAGFGYLLYVDDKLNRLGGRKERPQIFKRIGLMNESYPEMILRSELFHSLIKSYV